MKKPDIQILAATSGSSIHVVSINGVQSYRCLDRDRAEAIEGMIDALMAVMKHNEEPCPEHYTEAIELAEQVLKKAGCR